MATQTSIEWTETTWNPVTGCHRISPGCKNCYAERFTKRLQAMGQSKYANGFHTVALHAQALHEPMKWKKSRVVFVNSMGDLFHKDVPLEFIHQVFQVMGEASQHHFQVLTKRSDRLFALNPFLPWTDNIWIGVSVERQDYTFRIDHLRETNATIKFLSLEPLLGPLSNLDLQGIDWVIAGGESGPGARVVEETWVIDIRDQCVEAQIPFFFKQWGGVRDKRGGNKALLEGRLWREMPVLRK